MWWWYYMLGHIYIHQAEAFWRTHLHKFVIASTDKILPIVQNIHGVDRTGFGSLQLSDLRGIILLPEGNSTVSPRGDELELIRMEADMHEECVHSHHVYSH